MYKLRILEYKDVIDELNQITNNNNFVKCSFSKTKYNIEIPYYTYGIGNNHIIVVGGTHGSEIITVDFVLRLMSDITNHNELYNDFTFHFIPVLNPEGYIISTSMVRTLIKKNMDESKIEEISKEYYINYREDDINSKNKLDKSIKLHQKKFINATYKDISDEYYLLKENVKKIYEENDNIPQGSIVVWRGNGDGIEINRDHKYNSWINYIKDGKKKYGNNRYNNIPDLVQGPLGAVCVDINNLDKHTLENTFLMTLIKKLYDEKNYCGLYTYHSTGASIYYRPSIYTPISLLSERDRLRFIEINTKLANSYKKYTKCILPNGIVKNGYRKIGISNLNGMDELLRVMYPGIMLIELSFMGGNPIGPYGDKTNNYIPTIDLNLKAFYETIELNKKLKKEMYK